MAQETPILSYSLIGKKLPDMTLPAFYEKDLKDIRLSAYKGTWLVLIFYPADFTFICPTELEIKKIAFPMLADPTGRLCRALGTYIEEEGLSLRATFIIDPDQVIKAYDIHDNSIGRSTAEILRKLQASKFVKEHKGMVCPVSWKPGGKTLKPGVNLVGKI
ncbi:redoxin domain-containing protein [Candidatus Azambacteria bacterium]|nr:redoxin domain-containing protein [Candidatus Azambacteria bacterium]